MTDDERAIHKLVETWLAASAAGDLQAVLKLMSDDVVFMVPGRAPFGKEAFAASSKQMEKLRIEGKSEIVELKVIGDWAWMRNHLRMVITPPSGPSMIRSGYTLTILGRQSNGAWVIKRDANLLTMESSSDGTKIP